MNIAKVWNNDYPWDVRVEKICKTLIDDGHQVHLICSNHKREKTRDEIDGIQIHRLFPSKIKSLNNIFSIVAFFNPFWIRHIAQVVKKENIDIILIRDLPLVISALLVAKLSKIPVVFDMAENYPSMWKEHVDKRGLKCLNYILKNPTIATMMENFALKKVDHTIVVVKESKNRLISKGVPEHLISIVSNTPDLNFFDNTTLLTKVDLRQANGLKILYVGYVNGGRGLDTAIKAVPTIKQNLKEFTLIIAGGGEYLEELKALTRSLSIEKHVIFLGWVDSKLVPSYIDSCDICIVPHDTTEFVNTTIPNKIFDYMACKKPVIVSDAAPLKRIVQEANCGLVFKSKNPYNFSEKVLELLNPSKREKFGMNGFIATKEKYNWHHDSQILRNIFTQKGF